MSEIYTTGSWKPNPGSAEAFVVAWAQFAAWASSMPGAGRLRLVRDLRDPGRFVSLRLGEHRCGQELEELARVPRADGARPATRRRIPSD